MSLFSYLLPRPTLTLMASIGYFVMFSHCSSMECVRWMPTLEMECALYRGQCLELIQSFSVALFNILCCLWKDFRHCDSVTAFFFSSSFSFMSILLCMSYYSTSTKRQSIFKIQTGAWFVTKDTVHLTVLPTLLQLWGQRYFIFPAAVPLKILSSWQLMTCCHTLMSNEKKYCSLLFLCFNVTEEFAVIKIYEMWRDFYSNLLRQILKIFIWFCWNKLSTLLICSSFPDKTFNILISKVSNFL